MPARSTGSRTGGFCFTLTHSASTDGGALYPNPLFLRPAGNREQSESFALCSVVGHCNSISTDTSQPRPDDDDTGWRYRCCSFFGAPFFIAHFNPCKSGGGPTHKKLSKYFPTKAIRFNCRLIVLLMDSVTGMGGGWTRLGRDDAYNKMNCGQPQNCPSK